ncbi:DUF7507 domain-containing protein [Paenibacillus methanolicus]|uniref:Putative repeat protein (TIGR01451 family) n=1 Tax=Paenibacillus methanolicus TaxID=582686 RepID=A0A5S5C1T1_9BACL|nr:DUF11 domain-containing protein [Paenibacillus methanolicus]TYP72422.1 putative repeat protein (TIGR01451 family) [Paenibacillus methanolicus]
MILIPIITRATFNATGAITFTGNALGLSRSDTSGVPGTQDSIGAFATTASTGAFGSYPSGTTNAYASNSASAILTLPAGSSVLYAELVWGGCYINGNVDLSAFINNPVTFATPSGTFSISPDAATSNTVNLGSGAFAYTRSANVTTQVQQAGAGTYTTGGVVGTIVINNDPTANHAGWTLGVIYYNPNLPFRNMSLRAGAVLVQSTSGPVTTTLTGFATPLSGTLGGRALFSAQEGDANRTGDQALFGPTSATAAALSGPNNFATNFFASQINGDAGTLNTTGTFGTRNQTNGTPGTNIVGGRQGWDITNVDVSARLVNNQSSAVLILTTSGDAYVLNANAIQININAPNVTLTKSANVSGAIVGDVITYTATVRNTGTANASSVVLTDPLPSGLSFVSGSVTVDGVSRPNYDILAGVPIGTLAINGAVTITYRTTVSSNPTQVANSANAAFSFQSVAGGSTITGVIPSNTVTTPVYAPVVSIVKSANRASATVGSTVTYTLAIRNAGNIGAATTVADNIPTGSSFIAGTFRVNGTVVPGANPAAGVAIGTVAAGATVSVTFDVQVNAVPTPPQFVDQGTAQYTYSPPDGRTLPGSASSNVIALPVSLPNVTVAKTASLSSATVGDTITYTSVVANNGTEAVTNVILSDALPAGSQFVGGSVTVGGTSAPAANPASGITIGTLAASSSVTVTLQALVVSVPANGQLLNRSSLSYSSGTLAAGATSNTTTTNVFRPVVNLAKSANANAATVGDTITYAIAVTNTGNISAAVTISDNIPAGSSFVPNSVTINGSASPGLSPATGFSIGTIAPGGGATITFQTVVNSLPSPAVLTDQATANFSFTLASGRTITGASSSNALTIPVSAPNVTIAKAASDTSAAVGEPLTYSIAVANNGGAPVSSVVLSDPAPSGSAFVAGSVTIDGIPFAAANPGAGIALGTLNPGGVVGVSFQIRVTGIPESGQLANAASASFTSGAFSGASISNTVATPIAQAVIAVVKSASLANATVGDTFTYSFELTNSGNTAANVTLTDQVPEACVFIANSVLVGGTPVPGTSPVTGIPVGSVPPGGSVVVSFVVAIETYPSSRQLVNQAQAAFSFTLPNGRSVNGAASSNTVIVPVALPSVSILKSVDRANAIVGDALRYTSILTNNGGSPINGVNIRDLLAENIAFTPGTVFVNGVSRPAASPADGISIGSLAPGGSVTVTFEVSVIMAIPSQVTNQSTASFTSGTFSAISASNVTTTPVTQPQIALVKSSSTNNATLGGSITYTIVISNTGNLPANVTLADTLPAGTTFTDNSVIVGGVPQPGASPVTGIAVGSVAPGATVTVTFGVVVTSLPSPQQLTNTASSTFTYTPPDGRLITGAAQSNTVSFPVSAPNVGVALSTPSTALTVGDTVTYTAVITNSGIDPVSSVQYTTPLPPGTSFVPGTVTVNGAPAPGASPISGVPIGTIAPGASATVTYTLLVDAVPTPTRIDATGSATFTSGAFSGVSFSNAITTPVYQPVIAAAKSASTTNATVGNTVTYSFSMTNSGNYPASVTLTDSIPAGTAFLANSVLVNGTPLPGADPVTGISAGSIAPGASLQVFFSVVIETLPNPQQIVNQGTASFSYTLPDGRTFSQSSVSNTVTIPVSAPNVAVVKSTPSTALAVGDTVTYSTSVTNSGIDSVNNVQFTDPLPAGTALVPGSVTVDGIVRPDGNPATGIIIGSLTPGQVVVINFNATVTTLPDPAVLNNQSSVTFTSGVFSGVTFSNITTTPVFQPILSAVKSAGTTAATVGDTVTYTINLSNTGNYGATVTLTDTIPTGTVFLTNSVLVGGQPVPGADPSTGIPLGIVTTSVDVSFSVVVESLPPNQLLTNQASATYTFTLPDGRTLGGSLSSNTVTIPVSAPNIAIVKSTPAIDAVVGDTITYTITVTNSGIANISNAVLTDAIPIGASFVPNSVTVDGLPRPGAIPSNGVSLGTIAPGGFVTAAFSVSVTNLPEPPELGNRASVTFTSGAFSGSALSNLVVTPVYQPIIILLKSANTTNATVGDTINYLLFVTNTGNLPATATVTDQIPVGGAFVPNSVLVNGVPQPGADPTTGIPVGIVNPGEMVSVTVSLQVTVDTLPIGQQLVNQAAASFTYSPPDGRVLTGSVDSNTLVIPVSSPDVSVVKSTAAIDAVVGDMITYSIAITNNGISPVNNVVLVDPDPIGTVFVPGSITVAGAARPAANPNTGIVVGTIASGGSVTVTFQVQVVTI